MARPHRILVVLNQNNESNLSITSPGPVTPPVIEFHTARPSTATSQDPSQRNALCVGSDFSM
jgi:hypothetical protein